MGTSPVIGDTQKMILLMLASKPIPITPFTGVILSEAAPFNAKLSTSFKPNIMVKNVGFLEIASSNNEDEALDDMRT